MLWSPVGLGVADVEDKVVQNLGTHARVAYFGMKLHGKHLLRGILDRSKRIGRLSCQRESWRQLHSFVHVRHPDFQRFWQSGEELGFCDDLDFSVPILALLRGIYFSAEHMNHQLQAITDAQHWHTELEDARIGVGS